MKIVSHFSYGSATPSRQDRLNKTDTYCGHEKRAGTIIIENLPLPEDIENWSLRCCGNKLYLRIGVARVHPKDDFNRKDGLRVATENMETVAATIETIFINSVRIRVEFVTELGNIRISYTMGVPSRPRLDSQTIIGCNC